MAPQVLFEDRVFPTEDGKANLITEVAHDPPLPTAGRPLLLMAISTEKAQASQALPGQQEGPAAATVHPDAAPGFKAGERVIVESEIGSLEVLLTFDECQRTDVLLMPKGGWLSAGRCANVLIPAEMTDLGGGACYYDTPVCLKPLEESSRNAQT